MKYKIKMLIVDIKKQKNEIDNLGIEIKMVRKYI